MGLFDRFKKRVKDVVDETDQTNLSVEADSEEGQATLLRESVKVDDEWEDLDALEAAPEVESESSDDDWDDWDDDEPVINRVLSRKERKLLERQEKDRKRAEDRAKKTLKKRGATEMARPRGSKVDLSMMRTTTGRQLVEVAQTPRFDLDDKNCTRWCFFKRVDLIVSLILGNGTINTECRAFHVLFDVVHFSSKLTEDEGLFIWVCLNHIEKGLHLVRPTNPLFRLRSILLGDTI